MAKFKVSVKKVVEIEKLIIDTRDQNDAAEKAKEIIDSYEIYPDVDVIVQTTITCEKVGK